VVAEGRRKPVACRAAPGKAVPLRLVESALLLALLRRLVPAADAPPLPPIRWPIFQPVIAELQHQPIPEHHLDYLRAKLRKAVSPPPVAVQKNTFSDDR
jgi:hypothetical protein